MDILLIGGTRNVGHHLAVALTDRGHRVTTFNRGATPDELGDRVERLHGDRSDPAQLPGALGGRSWDAAVDTIAMRGADTRGAIAALTGRVGHYLHFSTGQVYLVREGRPAPARETDYDGPLRAAPPAESWEMREWLYGVEKRECEDLLAEAWATARFPATRLRLPMINGERDHYARIRGYLLRLTDGAPLLVPEESGPPLRHLDQADAVAAIVQLVESGAGKGEAYNLAADEPWSFEAFLARLAAAAGVEPVVVRRPRAALAAAGVFPVCSPFSNPWMSVLDNARARAELGLTFTSQEATLDRVAAHCLATPSLVPPAYPAVRARELAVAAAKGTAAAPERY